jgi:hypothetical protein
VVIIVRLIIKIVFGRATITVARFIFCLLCHESLTEIAGFGIGSILRAALCQQFSQFKN